MSAFVYAIEDPTGSVKIGWSTNPDERLKTLRSARGIPLALVYVERADDCGVAFAIERECHAALSKRRMLGEWFQITADEARQAIKGAVKTVAAPILDPGVCRAARSFAGMNQTQLAKAADVSLQILKRFEAERATPLRSELVRMRAALEAAGVVFIEENGGGEGVRKAKPRGRKK